MIVSQFVSPILTGVLTLLGVLHLIWALGSHFPCANEQALARAVIGRRGITKMPSPMACAFVAFWLFAAAVWAALLGGLISNPLQAGVSKWGMTILGLLAGLVFLGRGIIGILPAFERASPELPFLKLNRRIYSPLCLLIGMGFMILVFSIPNWTWRFNLG